MNIFHKNRIVGAFGQFLFHIVKKECRYILPRRIAGNGITENRRELFGPGPVQMMRVGVFPRTQVEHARVLIERKVPVHKIISDANCSSAST